MIHTDYFVLLFFAAIFIIFLIGHILDKDKNDNGGSYM